MLIDLHVHTSRYSECGKATPEEMVGRAIELGYDALVLTEHNVLWGAEETAELQAAFPRIRVFRGIEVTIDTGDHVLVYGVTDPAVLAEKQSLCELVRGVRRLGGALLLAHPYRYNDDVPADLEVCRVDGVEVLSNNMFNYSHRKALDLARQLELPTYAATDAHQPDTLGLYGVRFNGHRIDTELDLAATVRRAVFTLHVDHERIAAQNAGLPEVIARVQPLIDLGQSNEEIYRATGVGYTVIRGVREGLDIGRPV